MLVKLAACLKYLCGFLLSLKAQGGAVEHLKSKQRQSINNTIAAKT
jgi:hypothetical protein